MIRIRNLSALLSALILMEPGEGFTAEEFAAAEKSLKIRGVKTNAVVNLATGSVTASGDPAVMTPYWTGECYKAVVVPQTVSSDSDLIVVTLGDVTYTHAREFTFTSGTQHKLTITVHKASSGLNISIENWITDETDYVGDAR